MLKLRFVDDLTQSEIADAHRRLADAGLAPDPPRARPPAHGRRVGLIRAPRERVAGPASDPKQRKEAPWACIDKITGRAKKAAGDLADDPSLRRQGRQEERKGEAKDELSDAQDKADGQGRRGHDLERKTS